MTFQVQPFSAAHLAALAGIGDIPNMNEAYVQGEKAGRNRLAAQGQQEAARMMAAGDRQGAINRLLSVADPGEALRYQIALENQQAESARQGVLDQRYAAEQRQQDEHYNAQQKYQQAMLKIQMDQENRARRADFYKNAPYGATYPGDQGGAPEAGAPPQPYGPVNQDYAPPAPQAPPTPPPQAMMPSPTTIPGSEAGAGNMDRPMTPELGGPAPGGPAQQPAATAVQAQVSPTPAYTPSPLAQRLTSDPEKQRQVDDVIAAQGTRDDIMKVLTAAPREQGAPRAFTMEQDTAKEWRQNPTAIDFQKRAAAYQDFNQSFELAIDDKNPNPAAQLSAIYAFVKSNDPTGAVLNGDVNLLQENAAGFIATLKNAYPKWKEGSPLPREALVNMKKTVDAKFADAFKRYQTIEKQQRGVAQGRGLDQYNAVPDLSAGVRPGTFDPNAGLPPFPSRNTAPGYNRGGMQPPPAPTDPPPGFLDWLWKMGG